MIDFILERYNYWIVIILMMAGLYIVFSRGNLVKTVVGLNVFQTSVFIFYITLGKVAGGTAPILPYPNPDKYGDAHGSDHGDSHGKDYSAKVHDEPHADGNDHDAEGELAVQDTGELVANHAGALSEDEAMAVLSGEISNALEANAPGDVAGAEEVPPESLHDFSEVDASNSLREQIPEFVEETTVEGITITSGGPETIVADAGIAGSAYDASGDTAQAAAEVLYSNPLPHVLILTAIVVGVATTAVGLALAVRIREAYGTIEEDALERMDNEAATGSPTGEGGKA